MAINKNACCGASLTCNAIVFLILGAQLPLMINKLIQDGLDEELVVDSYDDPLYDEWLTNEDHDDPPEYYVIYGFNMTNLDAVLAGARPNVQEVGPYVYRTTKRKIDVIFGDDGSWSGQSLDNVNTGVSAMYTPYNFVKFDREESTKRGLDPERDPTKDLFCTVDKIYAGAVAISPAAERGLYLLGQRYFFGQDEWPMVALETLMFGRPEPYIFNYTDEEDARELQMEWAFNTGKNSRDEVRRQMVWKSTKQVMDLWFDPVTGEPDYEYVRGTDASQFNGGLKEGDRLDVWEKDIIRGVYLQNYDKERSKYRGIDLLNFRVEPETYYSCEIYPTNCKFDMHQNGLINLQIIALGIPLYASQAHMYGVDAEYADTVTGLTPDRDSHTSFINVEPFSGITMNAGKVAQIQIRVGPTGAGYYDGLANNTYLPIFWYIEGGSINKPKADEFKEGVVFGRGFVDFSEIFFPIVGSFMLVGGLVLCKRYHDEIFAKRDAFGTLGDTEYMKARLINP